MKSLPEVHEGDVLDGVSATIQNIALMDFGQEMCIRDRPTGVIRESCLDASLAPFFSESTHILRNLQILRGFPPNVRRS